MYKRQDYDSKKNVEKAVVTMYNPQLETFIRVADAGSFNKAAEQAYITPTAVIKQMNLLEDGLGVKLFERKMCIRDSLYDDYGGRHGESWFL